MSLKLGSKTTIVISSPEIAKEMFIKHDLAFSSRPIPESARVGDHAKYSIVWLPVCPKWRNLRKIATLQLFTAQKLDASQGLRHKKVQELVEFVRECQENGLHADINKAAFTTTLNLLSNTILSVDLASYGSSSAQEFKDLFSRSMELAGKPNVSDFFPLIKRFDLQGVCKMRRFYYGKIMDFFVDIIDTRLKNPRDDKDDVLATLLELVHDKELTLDEVKHLILDLFIAGTDTTSNTLEWIMTELLFNPEKMKRAQIEIDQELGKDGLVKESQITKLHYLQAIVKETMRLHPAGPFLVPHKAEKSTQICNYLVPKHSTIWVNVWSIGHDPKVWSEPELFSPERFLEKEMDIKGRHYDIIPFGSGRRICPGLPLAHRMLHLMLANLLHSFNWKYGNKSCSKAVSLEERFGLTLQKAEPLQAIPFSR